MLYHVDDLVLNEIKAVRDNLDYKISVCRDLNTALNTKYVLLQIRNQRLKRAVMECMETETRDSDQKKSWIACFLLEDVLYYVFNYAQQRRFDSFSTSQLVDTYSWEHAALNLVIECMSNTLPFPILYLLLDNETINIARDDSIFFTYYFMLENFDRNITEVDCVAKCSATVLKILEHAQMGKRKKLKSLMLIQKKVDHNAYKTFAEIYKDIKYCAVSNKKIPFYKRWWGYLVERKDVAFKVLLVISGFLLILAIIMLLSQLIFGDASFLKFGYSIDQIGTESMLK